MTQEKKLLQYKENTIQSKERTLAYTNRITKLEQLSNQKYLKTINTEKLYQYC